MLARPASNGARRPTAVALLGVLAFAVLLVIVTGLLFASAAALTVTTDRRPVQASFSCPTPDPVPPAGPTSISCP
jgi:hypothetical protein